MLTLCDVVSLVSATQWGPKPVAQEPGGVLPPAPLGPNKSMDFTEAVASL